LRRNQNERNLGDQAVLQKVSKPWNMKQDLRRHSAGKVVLQKLSKPRNRPVFTGFPKFQTGTSSLPRFCNSLQKLQEPWNKPVNTGGNTTVRECATTSLYAAKAVLQILRKSWNRPGKWMTKMRMNLLLVTMCVVLVSFGRVVPQEMEKTAGTWITDYGIYQIPDLLLRFDRYSKGDLDRFKDKLESLKKSAYKGKWEGIYTYDFPDQVGISELRLNSKAGFAQFYVYSCMPELRSLDYGKVVETEGTIELVPNLADDSLQKTKPTVYVKVSWGKRRYLVEESSLSAFAEKAAGVYVEPEDDNSTDNQKWSNYWVMGDLDAKLVGLPIYPAKYRSAQRLSITTRLLSVGKKFFPREFSIGNATYYQIAAFPIILSTGTRGGIKPGMVFYLKASDEKIIVKNVFPNSSQAILLRDLDDDKRETCLNSSYRSNRCPKIMGGLIARTKVGNFWW